MIGAIRASTLLLTCLSIQSLVCAPIEPNQNQLQPENVVGTQFGGNFLPLSANQPEPQQPDWVMENILRGRKNTGQSLSIVNPLEVLRQRLLLEIARQRMASQSKQIEANRQYLEMIGK